MHEEELAVVLDGRVHAALNARVARDGQEVGVAIERLGVADAGELEAALRAEGERYERRGVRVSAIGYAAGRVGLRKELGPALTAGDLGNATSELPLRAAVAELRVGRNAIRRVFHRGVDHARAISQGAGVDELARVGCVEKVINERGQARAAGDELGDGERRLSFAPAGHDVSDGCIEVEEPLVRQAHEHADAHDLARGHDEIDAIGGVLPVTRRVHDPAVPVHHDGACSREALLGEEIADRGIEGTKIERGGCVQSAVSVTRGAALLQSLRAPRWFVAAAARRGEGRDERQERTLAGCPMIPSDERSVKEPQHATPWRLQRHPARLDYPEAPDRALATMNQLSWRTAAARRGSRSGSPTRPITRRTLPPWRARSAGPASLTSTSTRSPRAASTISSS
jgi:hypothetical protein